MLIDLHKDNIPHSSIPMPSESSEFLKSLDHPQSYSRVNLSYILEQVLVINLRSGDQIPRLGLNVQALLISKSCQLTSQYHLLSLQSPPRFKEARFTNNLR